MKIQYLTKPEELQAMRQIRYEVFVVEQKVDPTIEIDHYDQSHPNIQYLGAFIDQRLVATLRIREEQNSWILQRIAVVKEYRQQAIGSKLVNFCIVAAKNKKLKQIMLHSQVYVLDFYLKLGFIAQGDVFEEAKILHQEVIFPISD